MNEDNNMATFLGGEYVEISKEINGKKRVFVKCLPVRQFAEYAALIAIECELIALATDLNAEEIDMLTPDESGEIFEKIHELNFYPFSAWLKRKATATKMKAQAYGASLPKEENLISGEDSVSSQPELS